MTCQEARELFSALVDEALDADERARLEAHLAGCAPCRHELEALQRTVSLLRGAEPVRAPAGFVDRVLAGAERPPRWRRLARRLFTPWPVKLPLEAAAVAVVAVTAVYLYRAIPEQQTGSDQAPGRQSVARAPSAEPGEPARSPSGKTSTSAARTAARQLGESRAGAARSPASPAETKTERADTASAPAAEPAREQRFAPGARAPSSGRSQSGEAESGEGSPVSEAPAPGGARAGAPGVAAPPAGLPGAPAPTPAVRDEARRKSAETAARARLEATKLTAAPVVSGWLTVADRDAARAQAMALVTRLGGSVATAPAGTEPPASAGGRSEADAIVLQLAVPRARYPELVGGLARLGRWVPDSEPAPGDDPVRVLVRIAR